MIMKQESTSELHFFYVHIIDRNAIIYNKLLLLSRPIQKMNTSYLYCNISAGCTIGRFQKTTTFGPFV